MPNRPALLLALLSALLVTAGCGGGGSDDDDLSAYAYVVDAQTGNDANDGSPGAPLKTITEALSRSIGGEAIKVLPGLYDALNGEVFPLMVPAGVTLEGDPGSRGNGTLATAIIGANDPGMNTPGRTMEIGAGAEVAGFVLQNPPPHPAQNALLESTVFIREPGVTLRRCTIENSTASGVIVRDNASGGAILENDISYLTGSGGYALVFFNAGSSCKVEGNRIRHNEGGVAVGMATPDLGGGVAGSAGNNTLAQNVNYDLRLGGTSISAQNNAWDHVPPEVVVSLPTPNGTGVDISLEEGALNADTAGAKPYLIITYIPKVPILPQP